MSLSRLHLRIHLDILNVFTISSIHSNPFPLSQPSPPCTRLDTDVNVFLTISTIHSPIPLLSLILISVFNSLHFRRQFQLFISSPSSMYPRTPLPSTLNTSRFPLGASSVSIHLSQCRLLCPCVSYADVCVTVLGTSFILSSSFRLLAVSAFFSLQLFNTYVESVLSMQFYSVRSQALGLVESVPAFTFSPTFRRRPDVHLSLTSGWVHLGLNSCRIQTVCLHLIGSVLMFSPSRSGFLR